jgi:uncharacterized membrane protein (UPF0127 family)
MKVFNKDRLIFSKARVLNSFGLMFRSKPKENEAIILRLKRESQFFSAIHMLFVFYPIHVIWLNKQNIVVDIKRCYPFQPFSMPKNPASLIIECINLPKINLNDRLTMH